MKILVLFALVSLFVSSEAAASIKSFSADISWTTAIGSSTATRTGKIYYDYANLQDAIEWSIGGSLSSTEIVSYEDQSRQQICGGNCQYIVWTLSQWRYFFDTAAGDSSAGTQTIPGCTNCNKYNLVQNNAGWTAVGYFNPSSGLVVRVVLTNSAKGETDTIDFSNVVAGASFNIFTPPPACSGKPLQCFSQTDIVLVLDDSSSIDAAGWTSSTQFCSALVDAFPKISATDVRIGVVTFSDYSTTILDLNANRATIKSAITSIVRNSSQTATAAGINRAQQLLAASTRTGISKVILMLTDGDPTFPTVATATTNMINAATAAKNAGTIVYALGVGSTAQINDQNLAYLASPNPPNWSKSTPKYRSRVSSFSALQVVNDIVIGLCPDGQQTCSPNCNPVYGFCECGACSCTNPAGQCFNQGNPTDATCTVASNKPCTCASWCGNGATTFDCHCTCSANWLNNPTTGKCDVCDVSTYESNNCNGRGAGVQNLATCTGCKCVSPWANGGTCTTCGLTQSDCVHGTVDSTNCKCVCDASWLNYNSSNWSPCSVCNVNYYKSTSCNGRGTGVQDTANCQGCKCAFPWADGGSCTTCGLTNCGNGVVNNTNGACECKCNSNWLNANTADKTTSCTVCDVSGFQQSVCKGRGTITSSSTCSGCTCSGNWQSSGAPGANCDSCSLTSCSTGTLNTAICSCSCPQFLSGTSCEVCDSAGSVAAHCNGRGTGVLDPVTCTGCTCQAPWKNGPDCLTCGLTDCGNGVVDTSGGGCKCKCNQFWKNANPNDPTSKCTTCDASTFGQIQCQNRGTVVNATACTGCNCNGNWADGNDCLTCGLSSCGYGSVVLSTCTCNCNQYFSANPVQCTNCLANQYVADNCNGRGTGVNNTATCSGCNCQSPWAGLTCTTCPARNCGNGNLNTVTCQCDCNPYWSKSQTYGPCDTCLASSYYANNCNGRGVGILDANACFGCQCDPNQPWTGTFCDYCPTTRDCQHGTVDPNTCKCACSNNYWGVPSGQTYAACSVCLASTYYTTQCVNNRGTGVFNSTLCQGCKCSGYWQSGLNSDCSVCGITDCGHGTLVSSSCSCTCDQYWSKASGQPSCNVCNAQSYYQANCNGVGVGVSDTTTCTGCVCDSNTPWTGSDCKTCPARACGNGVLNPTTCQCDCNQYWKKSGNQWSSCNTCDQTTYAINNCGLNRNVNNLVYNLTTCTGCKCKAPWADNPNGDCSICPLTNAFCVNGNINTATCQCQCNQYWTTSANGACTTCLQQQYVNANCNGRGSAVLDPATCTGCVCNVPFNGTFCTGCARDDSYCLGNGLINTATCACVCDPYWQGNQCQSCTFNCVAGHGNYNANCDGCVCSGNWGGTNCQACTLTNAFCAHGTVNNNTCSTCNCPGGQYWTGAKCDSCTLTCQNRGTPLADCSACNCLGCGHGSPKSGIDCSCVCTGYWIKDAANNNSCTICDSTNANINLCSSRGTVSGSDCSTCTCPGCANGGTAGTNCACSCVAPWALQNGDCTKCTRTSATYCNGQGTINADCASCTCAQPYWTGPTCNVCTRPAGYCSNGGILNNSTCQCDCPAGSGFNDPTCSKCTWNCNGKGVVNSNCDGCLCNDTYWTGPNCAVCSRTPSFCQNGGSLQNCQCVCDVNTGWAGADCATCSYVDAQCNGYGSINANCSGCDCLGAFTGKFCGGCYRPQSFCQHSSILNTTSCDCECATPYWTGPDCNTCVRPSGFCTGVGAVVNNSTCGCDCLPGSGQSGALCELCSWSCTNRGIPNTACNSCVCDSPSIWKGVNCEVCARATDFPPENPFCQNKGTIDPVTCNCTCDPNAGWVSSIGNPDCTVCSWKDTLCNGHGHIAPSCDKCVCNDTFWTGQFCDVCTRAPDYCKNGAVLNTTSCTCTCPDGTGWSNEECDICTWTNDAGICNNNGYVSSDCRTCVCFDYLLWSGDKCDVCARTAADFCNGRGVVVETCDKCDCDPSTGFGGVRCDVCLRDNTFCPDKTKGVLNTTTCQCQCINGWSGEKCDGCPHTEADCTKFASSWDADSCACVCDTSQKYSGTFCEVCPPLDCGENGIATSTLNGVEDCKCLCFAGWEGDYCDSCVLTDTNCGFGQADPTSCTCSCTNPDWIGETCSQCARDPKVCDTEEPAGKRKLVLSSCLCECWGTTCDPNAGEFLNTTTCECDPCPLSDSICQAKYSKDWYLDIVKCQCTTSSDTSIYTGPTATQDYSTDTYDSPTGTTGGSGTKPTSTSTKTGTSAAGTSKTYAVTGECSSNSQCNGGTCKRPATPSSECKCLDGYSGQNCVYHQEPSIYARCDSNDDCNNNNGTCLNKGTLEAECICFEGWQTLKSQEQTGPFCDQVVHAPKPDQSISPKLSIASVVIVITFLFMVLIQ